MSSEHQLRFIASMTVGPSDIIKIRHHVNLAQANVNPLQDILITPMFAFKRSLEMSREMCEQGSRVMFDSGGYYVQLGRVKHEELYEPLLKTYKNNRWADIYTLPDHVPTSQDSPETVNEKVKDTIRFSEMFFNEMPDDLKPRAMPVVQGHSYRNVDDCLRAYIRLGVKKVGFGSFGTSGKNNQINVTTKNTVEIARHVIDVAHDNGMKVHLFGLGTPSLVAMIKGINADSFDSTTWLKCAGFGQVFLPFMRAYNICNGIDVSGFKKGIEFEQFNEWKRMTSHDCQLCENIADLSAHKMHRAVHNLIAITETVAMANKKDNERIKTIYKAGSPRYRYEFEKWLERSQEKFANIFFNKEQDVSTNR